MADHHIYIHGSIGGSSGGKSSKKTSPKLSQKIVDEEVSNTKVNANTIIQNIQKAYNTANNPFGAALDKAAKAVPIVAAIDAGIQIAKSVVSTSLDIATAYTGNSKLNMDWQNFQSLIQGTLHPISSALNLWKYSINLNNKNNTAEENRTLNGESNGRYV